jgi:hypothetical protein
MGTIFMLFIIKKRPLKSTLMSTLLFTATNGYSNRALRNQARSAFSFTELFNGAFFKEVDSIRRAVSGSALGRSVGIMTLQPAVDV